MKYLDTGSRAAGDAVASWLLSIPRERIAELRIQTGYFNNEPLGLIAGMLKTLREIDGPTVFLVGSNDRSTLVGHVNSLLAIAGPARSRLTIAIVETAGGLFHPKVIHVRLDTHSLAYVGSANFTGPGMAGENIEAGVVLDTSAGDPVSLTDSIAATIDTWLDGRQGIHLVKSPEDSQRLVDEGILGVPVPHSTTKSPPDPQQNTVTTGAVRVSRLVTLPGTPVAPVTGQGSPVAAPVVGTTAAAAKPAKPWKLVWRSAGLSRRDLSIPVGNNTNITGSIGLKRGDWDGQIDHRHYFRDEVFSDLVWKTEAGTKRESASAAVELWIEGVKVSDATVLISHNKDTQSRTYKQGNFMTSLRWGALRSIIANPEYLGSILLIDRMKGAKGAPSKYRLRIEVGD